MVDIEEVGKKKGTITHCKPGTHLSIPKDRVPTSALLAFGLDTTLFWDLCWDVGC